MTEQEQMEAMRNVQRSLFLAYNLAQSLNGQQKVPYDDEELAYIAGHAEKAKEIIERLHSLKSSQVKDA